MSHFSVLVGSYKVAMQSKINNTVSLAFKVAGAEWMLAVFQENFCSQSHAAFRASAQTQILSLLHFHCLTPVISKFVSHNNKQKQRLNTAPRYLARTSAGLDWQVRLQSPALWCTLVSAKYNIVGILFKT